MTANENLKIMMEMDDHEARMELLVDVILRETESDGEPYEKKGRAICQALLNNNANELLTALCGWSAASILAKAGLCCDKETLFDNEREAEISVIWDDDQENYDACVIDTETHEVTGFDPNIFVRENAEIKSVTIGYDDGSGAAQYQFVCVPKSKRNPAEADCDFWYDDTEVA